MRRVLAALFLLAPLFAFAEIKQPKPGFRDLKWGDPPPDTMKLTDKTDITATYTRPDDKMSIGAVPLESITYRYYRSQLLSVSIVAPREHFRDLLTTLTVQWGDPKRDNQFLDEYRWTSTDADLGLTIAGLEKPPVSGPATILIFSVKVYDEQEAERKALAKEAKDDV